MFVWNVHSAREMPSSCCLSGRHTKQEKCHLFLMRVCQKDDVCKRNAISFLPARKILSAREMPPISYLYGRNAQLEICQCFSICLGDTLSKTDASMFLSNWKSYLTEREGRTLLATRWSTTEIDSGTFLDVRRKLFTCISYQLGKP